MGSFSLMFGLGLECRLFGCGGVGCGSFDGSLDGGSGGLFATAATGAALLRAFFLGGKECFVVVNEFDEAHLGVITETVAGFEDAGVTSGAVSDFLRDFAEKFGNSIFVLEVRENEATVCHVVLF